MPKNSVVSKNSGLTSARNSDTTRYLRAIARFLATFAPVESICHPTDIIAPQPPTWSPGSQFAASSGLLWLVLFAITDGLSSRQCSCFCPFLTQGTWRPRVQSTWSNSQIVSWAIVTKHLLPHTSSNLTRLDPYKKTRAMMTMRKISERIRHQSRMPWTMTAMKRKR